MAKEILGDACAYIPAENRHEKTRYVRIGIAFKDGDRFSLKIDSLPLPGTGWEGWVNVFPPRDKQPAQAAAGSPVPFKPGTTGFDDLDDDIPF